MTSTYNETVSANDIRNLRAEAGQAGSGVLVHITAACAADLRARLKADALGVAC